MEKKEENNKKKKYWLIPAITLGIAILLLIFRCILVRLYPCSIENIQNLTTGWLNDSDTCHTPTKFRTIYYIAEMIQAILTYIGVISLPLVCTYYKKRKWIIPVLCLLIYIASVEFGAIVIHKGAVEPWSFFLTEGCKYGSGSNIARCVCDDPNGCLCTNRDYDSYSNKSCHVLNGYDLIYRQTLNTRIAIYEGIVSIPIILIYTVIEKKKKQQ